MRKTSLALVVVLSLLNSLPATAAQGRGQGRDKGKPAQAGKKDNKGKKDKAKKIDSERERHAAQGRAFGHEHERLIRDWFGNKSNLRGLPPGLAKRDKLPPGLQRHLERNGTLPPGLQKKIQPLPASLERQLPKIPEGVRRVVVAGNVILLEEKTARILDIVTDIFGGSKAGTRVRR